MPQKSGLDLINEAKSRIKQVTPAEAMADKSENLVFFDCREPQEYNLGHITGAVFIPRGQMETKVEAVISRDKKVVIYCASGNRSALAAETMMQMGYGDVASMSDGFRGWVDAGGEIE
ncbi:MAG: rhodanese-like domain-containing protein [Gemmatimonadales bacterium]